MQKWEYQCISILGGGEATTRQLNALGAEGWELIGVYGFIWHYFKRPLPGTSKKS